MEFGKVLPEQVNAVDFSLPEEGKRNVKVLKGEPADNPLFFIGCAKWGRKEWVNLIYPPKTKPADFLDEYVKHFNAIELNAVYYKIPAIEEVRKWRLKALKNTSRQFLFCPKFPKVISHDRRLVNAEGPTDEFISHIAEFEETLGPCFLQLSDNFGPQQIRVLEDYLKSLPVDLDVFVELRHEKWFSTPEVRDAIFEVFTRLRKGAVITDVSGRRDVAHMELTIPELFVRFVGNGSQHQASDFARIDEWAKRIKTWLDNGLEKVYFFLHQHDEADTPPLADYTAKVFNRELGSNLAEMSYQPSLF